MRHTCSGIHDTKPKVAYRCYTWTSLTPLGVWITPGCTALWKVCVGLTGDVVDINQGHIRKRLTARNSWALLRVCHSSHSWSDGAWTWWAHPLPKLRSPEAPRRRGSVNSGGWRQVQFWVISTKLKTRQVIINGWPNERKRGHGCTDVAGRLEDATQLDAVASKENPHNCFDKHHVRLQATGHKLNIFHTYVISIAFFLANCLLRGCPRLCDPYFFLFFATGALAQSLGNRWCKIQVEEEGTWGGADHKHTQ